MLFDSHIDFSGLLEENKIKLVAQDFKQSFEQVKYNKSKQQGPVAGQ